MAVVEFPQSFGYGATMLFVVFNAEDPTQLSAENDPKMKFRVKMTTILPIEAEKRQLIKLFDHFASLTMTGEGHLLHYHRIEILALQALGFLAKSDLTPS